MQISLVSQEPVLFARSITDNISYGLPAVPFEVVVEAAQKANAHGFIVELQDGYNTGTCPARSSPGAGLRVPTALRGTVASRAAQGLHSGAVHIMSQNRLQVNQLVAF